MSNSQSLGLDATLLAIGADVPMSAPATAGLARVDPEARCGSGKCGGGGEGGGSGDGGSGGEEDARGRGLERGCGYSRRCENLT